MIGFGLLQLARQDFVRLVPKLPPWIAQPSGWAVATGVLWLACGVAVAADKARRPAAILLTILFLLVLALYVPDVVSNPRAGFMWTNPFKTLALIGGCILLAALPVEENSQKSAAPKRSLVGARYLCAFLFGAFFVLCGIQHFVYADFVADMVPPWMPARHFWASFTGVALITGGLGLNFRRTAFLAAILSGLMIFLWIVVLHIPRAIASPQNPGELSGVFEALALSGTAFLLARINLSNRPAS